MVVLSYKTDHTQDFPEFCMTKENTENSYCIWNRLGYSDCLMNRTPYFLCDGNHNIEATEIIGEAKTLVRKASQLTGKLTEIIIGIDIQTFFQAFNAWDSGELLQDAFPTLSTDEREFIKTGITAQEWDAMFGEGH